MAKKKDEDFEMSDLENEEDPFAEGEEDLFDSSNPPEDQGYTDNFASPPYSSGKQEGGVEKKVTNLTGDIPVQIVAVLGKKPATVKEIISFKTGQVIEFNRLPNEAIDLVANGKLIAKGELVEIDGRLGIRILKMYS